MAGVMIQCQCTAAPCQAQPHIGHAECTSVKQTSSPDAWPSNVKGEVCPQCAKVNPDQIVAGA